MSNTATQKEGTYEIHVADSKGRSRRMNVKLAGPLGECIIAAGRIFGTTTVVLVPEVKAVATADRD